MNFTTRNPRTRVPQRVPLTRIRHPRLMEIALASPRKHGRTEKAVATASVAPPSERQLKTERVSRLFTRTVEMRRYLIEAHTKPCCGNSGHWWIRRKQNWGRSRLVRIFREH